MRTSAKPNKLYIIRKVLMRAIQKCNLYWIWATMSKVMGIFVKFWHFFLQCPLTNYGHVTWPKKQISKKFYLVIILHLISGKVTKFLVENLSTWEVIGQKPDVGWKTPPSAFRVNKDTIAQTFSSYIQFDCEGYALSDTFYRIEIELLVFKLCPVSFE